MSDDKEKKEDFKVGDEQFNVGDVVHLKCGGPNMVIEKLVPPGSSQYGMDREASATCIWLVEGREKKTDNFLLVCLGKGKGEDADSQKQESDKRKKEQQYEAYNRQPYDPLEEKHRAELQGREIDREELPR